MQDLIITIDGVHTRKPNTPFLCIETKEKSPYPIKKKIKCQLLGKQKSKRR